MYSGYIESDFVLQNYRCWQVMLSLLSWIITCGFA